MMEAVARRKAHWLFRAGSEKNFSGMRRPQEDMVTSAVFGSIRLMSPEDRLRAIEMLLGQNAFKATGFSKYHDIEIELWPRLNGSQGRRHVEPDVLLKAADKTAVVEVKWHAPLSEQQLEQQIEAVGFDKVSCVIMLGEAGIEEEICGKSGFRRTWRDVSGDLQELQTLRAKERISLTLRRWIETMCAFLQGTDMGRVFGGLSPIDAPGHVTFEFSKPGLPPWFDRAPSTAQPIQYTFGGNSDQRRNHRKRS